MTMRSKWPALLLLLAWGAAAAAPSGSISFEESVRMSDRIIVGTVLGTAGERARLFDGADITLGVKDPANGLVFTPYRVRIAMCLLDTDTACRPGDTEVHIPGGTVLEAVDGEPRLRTWEVAGAAGVPLPPAGDEVLLFMTKRNDRYFPLNDRGARVRVDRESAPASASASVVLRFESPRFLSAEGRAAAQAHVASGNPATTRPEFIEAVPLDRLRELITLTRQAPKPTSGTRHAIPDSADALAVVIGHERGVRVRTGDDGLWRETPLGLRDDLDSVHWTDHGRRACGP